MVRPPWDASDTRRMAPCCTRVQRWLGAVILESGMRWLAAMVLVTGLWLAGSAHAAAGPRYDVPRGFTRCPHAQAWNGFFKWASVQRTSCRRAAAFLREYAERAGGRPMPHHVAGYDCTI